MEEVSAEPTSRQGEWAVIRVTKRGITTATLTRAVASHFGLGREEVGTAGFKDRFAIATQELTIPARCARLAPPLLEGLERWKVRGYRDHPLRPGQLQENRFNVILAGWGETEGAALQQAWQEQRPTGWANYYGPQRFGPDNANWPLALAQLQHPPPRAQRQRWPHNYLLNSLQAQLFNEFLRRRVLSDRFAWLEAGEWFAEASQPREHLQAEHSGPLELTRLPLGPMFGHKLEVASADEQALLDEVALAPASFAPFRAPGSRRAWRLPLPKLETTVQPEGLQVKFALPPGCYATVLLEHFAQLSEPEEKPE